MNEPLALGSRSPLRRTRLCCFPVGVPQTKVPVSGSNGFLDATTDIEQIEKWWTQNPRYNIGLATAGLFVLELTARTSVPTQAFENHPDDYCAAPWSRAAGRTTFLVSPKTASRWGPRKRNRRSRGYQSQRRRRPVPPSIFIGKRYEWVEDAVRPDLLPVVPDWLVAELVSPTDNQSTRNRLPNLPAK